MAQPSADFDDDVGAWEAEVDAGDCRAVRSEHDLCLRAWKADAPYQLEKATLKVRLTSAVQQQFPEQHYAPRPEPLSSPRRSVSRESAVRRSRMALSMARSRFLALAPCVAQSMIALVAVVVRRPL